MILRWWAYSGVVSPKSDGALSLKMKKMSTTIICYYTTEWQLCEKVAAYISSILAIAKQKSSQISITKSLLSTTLVYLARVIKSKTNTETIWYYKRLQTNDYSGSTHQDFLFAATFSPCLHHSKRLQTYPLHSLSLWHAHSPS